MKEQIGLNPYGDLNKVKRLAIRIIKNYGMYDKTCQKHLDYIFSPTNYNEWYNAVWGGTIKYHNEKGKQIRYLTDAIYNKVLRLKYYSWTINTTDISFSEVAEKDKPLLEVKNLERYLKILD